MSDGLKDFVAGAAGGVCQLVVGHPLDTVKVKLQTGGSEYNGLVDVCKKIVARDGLKGFYKGVASPLIGFMGLNAVLFSSYGVGEKIFRYGVPDGQITPLSRVFLIGCYAGVHVSFVECPMDLFKAKMQAQVPRADGTLLYRSTFDCVKQTITGYGIKGAYQGLVATMIRNIPANGFYFVGYEYTKRALSGGKEPTAPVLLTAGGVAGLSYWLLVYPADAVKTLVQTDASNVADRTYKGFFDCAKKIYQTRGISAFFRGFAPAMLRAFPANAACFYGYEVTRKLLG